MGYHNKKCGYVNENYAFIYTEKLDNLDHKTKLKRAKVFRDKYLRILILIKFFLLQNIIKATRHPYGHS